MSAAKLEAALKVCPLVAILRGVKPEEAAAMGHALVDAGFSIIEVPLNSPDPFTSIATMVRELPADVLIGAGTVLTTDDVAKLADAGGQLMVSPNTNPAVIKAAADAGMASLPGFSTVSEAFTALEAGATGLKLFPTDGYPPSYLKAISAVLPKGIGLFPVGGVNTTNMQPWVDAGAAGFGLGSSLYKAGRSVEEVAEAARAHVAAVKATGLCQ